MSAMDLDLAGFTLLQVTPALETGGVERTTLDIADAVVKAGGRALVASRGGRMEAELASVGGQLVRLPMESKNPLIQAQNGSRLLTLIRTEKVDLVHVRSRAPAFAGLWAAQQANLPTVATYHGLYNSKTPLKRWYNGVMTRTDRVIANSEFTRAHILATHKIAPEKVNSIPRGVDLRRFDPAKVTKDRVESLRRLFRGEGDFDAPLFLLAGRLTRWKGQAFLIDAIAAAAITGAPPIRVAFAGDDQGRHAYREELEGKIALNGLADRVRIVGHCDDMPAAYLAADFAVVPSLEPEAFGRTAVEPQAMGIPVLAANHGGTAETVVAGETGWLVTPGSVTDWAISLSRAAQTPLTLRQKMGEAGRVRVAELYSREAMCRQTLKIYRELWSQRHG